MAEWIKYALNYPFQYGLKQLNIISMNTITIFFNNYGNKLLKINDDIISRHECVDDADIFYLCPLHIKNNLSHTLGPNLIIIESGIINETTVSFPWKAVLSDSTCIKINSIELTISIEKNMCIENNLSKCMMSTNSMLTENQDLINVHDDISDIINQYFNKINVDIQSIKITIENHFVINMSNIKYNNNILHIQDVTIVSETIGIFHAHNITYAVDESKLHVESVSINPELIDQMPILYVSDTSNMSELLVVIDALEMADIHIRELSIKITSDTFMIQNLSQIVMDDIIIIFSKSKYVIQYDRTKNIYFMDSVCDIRLSKIDKLTERSDYLNNLFEKLLNKFVNDGMAKKNNDIIIENVKIMIFYLGNQFCLNVAKIINLANGIMLMNIVVDDMQKSVQLTISNLNCANPLDLTDVCIKSDLFYGKGSRLQFDKTEQNLDIIFTNTHVREIAQLIDYITITYTALNPEPKLNTNSELNVSLDSTILIDEPPESKTKINFQIHDSSFVMIYDMTELEFVIESGYIHFTDKIATKINLGITMNGHIISKMTIDNINGENIEITTCKFYLDPEIFDQLNYLCGTLIPASENNISKQSIVAMGHSIVAESPKDLELIMNNFILDELVEYNAEPTIKLLLESISELQDVMINDYHMTDPNNYIIKIFLKSASIYLFDELTDGTDITNGAFLCVVLNNFSFDKSSIVNPKNNSIEVKYSLQIDNGGIIDVNSQNPEWKYFARPTHNGIVFKSNIIIHDGIYKIAANICPITVNIREETLIHLLSFFSNSHHIPTTGDPDTPVFVESFCMGKIDIIVNYFPLILKENTIGAEIFTLKNFKMILSQQYLKNINGFDILFDNVTNAWKLDVNPDNIMQFIPNIKIIQPCTATIIRFINLTTKYFGHTHNKRKIRAITKNITKGVSLVTGLIRLGLNQVIDLFD